MSSLHILKRTFTQAHTSRESGLQLASALFELLELDHDLPLEVRIGRLLRPHFQFGDLRVDLRERGLRLLPHRRVHRHLLLLLLLLHRHLLLLLLLLLLPLLHQ